MKRKITAITLLLLLLMQTLTFAMAMPSSTQKNLPKLILSDYSLSPEHPKAGEEFELTMTFYNTNEDYSARNIKVTLMNESSDRDPGSFGVFTPIGSSNTFYFDVIEAQESAEQTLRFATSSVALSKNYSLSVHLQYENYQGVQLEAKEFVGVPVMQSPRITMDDPSVPAEVQIDDGINLSIGFYNTGRDDLKNVMLETSGNFAADPARYFVGDFASGASDVFSTLLKTGEVGELSGVVTITFEDSSGQEHKLEKDFHSNVLPSSDAEVSPAENASLPLPMNTLLLLGLLILLILTVYFWLKWRREKKAQKVRNELTIDE